MVSTIFVLLLASVGIHGFVDDDYKGNRVPGEDNGAPVIVNGKVVVEPVKKINRLPCNHHETAETINACGSSKNLMQHPSNPNWYIRCDSNKKICQPCPYNLHFNNECQRCLQKGETCKPKPAFQELQNKCYNDGCSFCEKPFSWHKHTNPQFFCRCVFGNAMCMECPCEQTWHSKKKCCVVDKVNGRKCAKYL